MEGMTFTTWRRRLSTVAFGLAVALLLLPVATMSACGQEFKASGADLAEVAPSLVVNHVWYPGGWSFALFDLIPLLLAAGLAVQALRGGRTAVITIGLSVAALVITVVEGFILPRAGHGSGEVFQHASRLSFANAIVIFGSGWRWQPAFYGAGVALSLPAIVSIIEMVRYRGRPGEQEGSIIATSPRGAGIIALVGALAVLAASLLPYAHFGPESGGPANPSIFNAGYPGSLWFAAEPVGAAGLAIVAGLALVLTNGRAFRMPAAGILIAVGVQEFLMYVGYASTGSYAGLQSQIGVGSEVGIIAGLCLLASGVLAATHERGSAGATETLGGGKSEGRPAAST
jgi:hypothetical protein